METGRRTALIVEDDPGLMGLLCEVLEDAGFATTCHRVGRSAVRALAEQRFDLIVTDVNLPDMSGLTLGEFAREQGGEDPVILVITGVKIQDRNVTALQLGADDFLGKPFRVDELLARIEAKLRRRPAA